MSSNDVEPGFQSSQSPVLQALSPTSEAETSALGSKVMLHNVTPHTSPACATTISDESKFKSNDRESTESTGINESTTSMLNSSLPVPTRDAINSSIETFCSFTTSELTISTSSLPASSISARSVVNNNADFEFASLASTNSCSASFVSINSGSITAVTSSDSIGCMLANCNSTISVLTSSASNIATPSSCKSISSALRGGGTTICIPADSASKCCNSDVLGALGSSSVACDSIKSELTSSALTNSKLSNCECLGSTLDRSILTNSAPNSSATIPSELNSSLLVKPVLTNSRLANPGLANLALTTSALNFSSLTSCAPVNLSVIDSAISTSTVVSPVLANSARPSPVLTGSDLPSSASNPCCSVITCRPLTSTASTNSSSSCLVSHPLLVQPSHSLPAATQVQSDCQSVIESTTTDCNRVIVSATTDCHRVIDSATASKCDDTEELKLEVTCGQNSACLYMNRLQLGSKGTCVLFDSAWLTPNEFQYVSGRETAKDWKRSIKHHGKSLKVLIAKGILSTAPPQCTCTQCAQPTENDETINQRPAIALEMNRGSVPSATSSTVTAKCGTSVDLMSATSQGLHVSGHSIQTFGGNPVNNLLSKTEGQSVQGRDHSVLEPKHEIQNNQNNNKVANDERPMCSGLSDQKNNNNNKDQYSSCCNRNNCNTINNTDRNTTIIGRTSNSASSDNRCQSGICAVREETSEDRRTASEKESYDREKGRKRRFSESSSSFSEASTDTSQRSSRDHTSRPQLNSCEKLQKPGSGSFKSPPPFSSGNNNSSIKNNNYINNNTGSCNHTLSCCAEESSPLQQCASNTLPADSCVKQLQQLYSAVPPPGSADLAAGWLWWRRGMESLYSPQTEPYVTGVDGLYPPPTNPFLSSATPVDPWAAYLHGLSNKIPRYGQLYPEPWSGSDHLPIYYPQLHMQLQNQLIQQQQQHLYQQQLLQTRYSYPYSSLMLSSSVRQESCIPPERSTSLYMPPFFPSFASRFCI